MFDLNEEIAKWRTALAESEKCSKPDIDELETHLRDEIEQLTAAKLSQEESFLLARRRLGDAGSLENEFAKVNGGYILKRRLVWMVAGGLVYVLARSLGGAAGNASVLFAVLAGSRASVAGAIGVFAAALSFSVVLLLVYLVCERWRGISRFDRLACGLRGKIVLLGLVLLVVLMVGSIVLLSSFVMDRTMPANEIGRIAEIFAYARLIVSLLLPVALVALLARLRTTVGA